ncbi:uncharacterized protein LOC144784128 [Lissotriton helveticus]
MKMSEIQKQAGVTGGGRNSAAPLTDLEELVASTIEADSLLGLGDVDSSARATRKGATSGSRPTETEGTAPAREESEEAGPSQVQASQEEDDTTGISHEDERVQTPEFPHSPHLSQSPPLVFSPQTSPSLFLSAPATPPARRRVVAPLPVMEAAEGEAQLTVYVSPAALQSTNEPVTLRRRQRRPSSAGGRGDGTVFRGLEGSMVRIQQMQGKSIQACHRQFRILNKQIEDTGKGIRDIVESNKEVAKTNADISEGMQQMSTPLPSSAQN